MRTNINKKSDFDFIVLDSEGNAIDMPTSNFTLDLWTWGSKCRFRASSIGGVLKGCKNDGGKLRVYVDNPGFVPGKLVGEWVTYAASEEYADGSQRTCRYISDFGIDMVDGDSITNEQQVLAMMQYIKGASAYEIACEHGYQGTEEEWLNSLSLESVNAANECRELMAQLSAAEDVRNANEQNRNVAEDERSATEQARVTAENNRAKSEADRNAAEKNRATAELNRDFHESTRSTAETQRVSAENERIVNEQSRVASEESRVTAEESRQANEQTRATAEASRIAAESSRDRTHDRLKTAMREYANAESLRDESEAERREAEQYRIEYEQSRQSAEADRATNERNRATAEQQRVTAETARSNAESSRATAETARQEAETARQEAEQGRATAEQQRADAEAARAEEFATFEGKIAAKEDAANKVTSIGADANNTTFPTTRAVLNSIAEVKNIEVTPEMLSESTKQYINASGGGTITNFADDEDLTSVDNALKLADKTYDPITYSGMGRKYLRKNMVDGKNILTQDMLPSANTIYIIQYDYDLNGATITIPENCVLEFRGGIFSNGTILGGETVIDATITQIFNNINIDGTWNVKETVPEWFGTCGVYNTDDSENIELAAKLAICSSSKQGVLRLNNKYYVSKPVFIDKGVSLVGVTSQTTDISKIQLLANPNFLPVEHNGLMITSLLWMQGYADVRNLSLQGRNDIWCSGIYVIDSTAQGRVVDCMFNRFTLMGIYLKGSEDFIIDKVRMSSCGISVKVTAFNNTDTLNSEDYYGIYNFFGGASKVYSVNLLKIINCYMLYSNVHICVEGGYDVNIQNTCTSRASIAGIVCDRVTSSNIVGNYTEEDAIAGWFYEKNTTEPFFTWGDDATDRTVSQSLIDKGLNGFAVTNNTDSRVRAWIVLSNCQRLNISRNNISYRKRGKIRDNSVNLTSHELLGSDAAIFAIGCHKINIVDNNYYQPVTNNSAEERYRRIKEVIFDANSVNRFIYQRSNLVNDGNNSWVGWGTFLQDYRIEGLTTDDINKRTLVQFSNDSYKPFPANHEIGFIDNKGLSLFKFNERAQFSGTRFPISVFGDDVCVLKAKCLNPNNERFIGTFTMQWRDTAGTVIASLTYGNLTKVDTENEDTNIYSIGIAFYPKLPGAATVNFVFLQAAADESVALSCPFFEGNGLPYDDYSCNLDGFPRTPVTNKPYKKQAKDYLYNGDAWVDADGVPAESKKDGTTTERPTGVLAGFQYFDTTLNKPIWWTGSAWVDATGQEV